MPLQDVPSGVALNGVSPSSTTLTVSDPRRMTVTPLGSLRKVSVERMDSPSRFSSDTISQTENDSPQWSSAIGPAASSGKSGRVIERLMAENDRLKRDLELQLLRSQELERNLQTMRPQLEALRAENSNLTHLKSVDGGLLARRDRKIESLKEDLASERTRRESSEALVRSTLNDTEDALERAKRNIQQAQEEAKHATVHAGILEQSHRQLATDYRTRAQNWRKDLDDIHSDRRADKTKLAKLEVVADHMRQELERSRKAQSEYASHFGEYRQANERWRQELESTAVAETKRSKELSDDMEAVVNKMRWVMSNHALQEEKALKEGHSASKT